VFGNSCRAFPVLLGQQKNTDQDAQKVQTSHPPNPGTPRRAFSQARPQRAVTFVRGGWDDPNCARLSHPPTHWHAETCHLPRARAFRFFIPLLKGVAKAALNCAHRTPSSFSMILPSLLASPPWNGTRVGPTAAVERAHSDRARSGSKGSARVSFHPFHRARSASKEGTWPLPPHLSEAARCASTGIVPATPSSLFQHPVRRVSLRSRSTGLETERAGHSRVFPMRGKKPVVSRCIRPVAHRSRAECRGPDEVHDGRTSAPPFPGPTG